MQPSARNYKRNTAVCAVLLFACASFVACGGSEGTPAGTGDTSSPTAGRPTSPAGTGAAANSSIATGGRGVTTGGSVATTAGGAATPTGGSQAGIHAATGGTTATATGGTTAPATAGTTAPPVPSDGSASVLQYHKNATRDGHYVDAAFTRAAAAMIKQDMSFTATVTGRMYAQPLYFEGGVGGADLVITATAMNEVTAFNAADGKQVWRKMLADAVSDGLPCGNIKPLGVTGTPVIDAATKTLYVAAMTTGPKHKIFALGLDDGEIKPGWPVDVDSVKAGSLSFKSSTQNQRGALVIANGSLFVPYGGHFGDCGDYHGWVVGVPLDNPAGVVGFATTALGGGIWAPGGLASDGTSVYAATGNTMSRPDGLFSSPATWGHGNAVLKLSKDLKPIAENQTQDFYAAENWKQLDTGDLDLGGSGPVLVSVPGATPSDLIVGLGKGGGAYLIGRPNLGGMGGELQMLMVSPGSISGGMIQAAAAYTTPTGTFVAFRSARQVMGCGTGSGQLGVLKISAEAPPKMSVAWCAAGATPASPIVTTTDGMSDSVVWQFSSGKLYGYNGETGMAIATGTATVPATVDFQTPIVAKGRIFIATNSGIVAYTLK